MKRTCLFLAVVLAVSLARADELLFQDNFRKSSWRAINTSEYAETADHALTLKDDRRYIASSRITTCDRGARLRFSVRAAAKAPVRLGMIFYGEKHRIEMGDPNTPAPDEEKSLSFEFAAPFRCKGVSLMICGEGTYREAKLERLFQPGYELRAYPPYQMVSGAPAKVVYRLFHNGQEVPGDGIESDGQDGWHPASGATAHAWIDQVADTAAFDSLAAKVHLEKPVKALYLGDSLTHYDLGHNHVDKVEYFLDKVMPGKFDACNYACGGDDISRVLDRLAGKGTGRWKNRYHDIWSRNYDWAFVFLGHNDTKASSANDFRIPAIPPEKQRELYLRLFAELRQRGIRRIVLISSTSSDFAVCKANSDKIGSSRVHNRFGAPEHLEAFNRTLQELAKDQPGIEYLDIYTEMKDMPDKSTLLRPSDGVHLSDAGHDYVALCVLRFLGKGAKP
ncbi:MAG: hypothetical protein IJJ33_04670 [Victivallales bacterium]|nr:hypothetical protein [Victivallales bacterium]